MKFNICIILILLFFNCKKENDKSLKQESEVDNNTKNDAKEIQLNKQFKVKKIFYVCAENGLNVRNAEDIVIGKLVNASQVSVSGYKGDIITIKDGDLVLKGRKAIVDFYEETEYYSKWVKAYVFEGYLCSLKDVKLHMSNICRVLNYSDGYDDVKEECLDSILKFELVSKTVYDNTIKKDYIFIENNLEISKINNVIQLPIKDSSIKIISKPNMEDETEDYDYLGEIPSLNSYLISGSYYESSNYMFYNRTSGDKFLSLQYYPNFSPKKNNIITLGFDPYDGSGVVELVKIKDEKVVNVNSLVFIDWSVADDDKIKWISNNTFLVKIVPCLTYWDENGGFNKNYQVLKVTIL